MEKGKKVEVNIGKLQAQIEALELKSQDLENKLKRALADYQNLQTRVEKQRSELIDFIKKDVIIKFLPILDNLERATKTMSDPGLQFVVKQFHKILEEEGLKIIGEKGETFDPLKHECIDVVAGEENKVIEVLEKGFCLGEKVVRVAKVKVGKSN